MTANHFILGLMAAIVLLALFALSGAIKALVNSKKEKKA